MYKSTNTKRETFISRQRKGDITLLSELTGYSVPHVSNVLAGRKFNAEIIDEAYKISFRRKPNSQLVGA